MEAIAMKMTQEEFDSIKGLIYIEEPIDSFKTHIYLINNFLGELGKITNVRDKNKVDFKRKIYEYFDKDIFLNACDIEVEKVWKGSQMQYLYKGEWIDCNDNNDFRFKPHPDYSKEIESLQDKAKLNGMKAIITFDKL